jgi:hypothetical protein
MIRRKATLGLALLCALLFSAIAVQSASAAAATNTTAFTCVKGGGTKDFKDAHCDEAVGPEKGEYGHVAIPLKETIKVALTNEKTAAGTTASTPAVLKSSLAGVTLEIQCTAANGEGTFKNEELVAKQHTGGGTGTTNMTKCTVTKPAKCTVKEPIALNVKGAPVEGLGAGKNEMGGEVKPIEGEIFVTITLEGAECALKGKPFEVKGTAIATGGTATQTNKHTGATAIYTNAMTKETLSIAGKPAEFSLATTVSSVGGTPIAGTTTT